MFDDLTSAAISLPLPAAPMATRCDGHYRFKYFYLHSLVTVFFLIKSYPITIFSQLYYDQLRPNELNT